MKCHFLRLKPNIILKHYCNLTRFNEWKFTANVKDADFSLETDYYNENFSVLTNTFSLLVGEACSTDKEYSEKKTCSFHCRESNKSHLHNKYAKNQVY